MIFELVIWLILDKIAFLKIIDRQLNNQWFMILKFRLLYCQLYSKIFLGKKSCTLAIEDKWTRPLRRLDASVYFFNSNTSRCPVHYSTGQIHLKVKALWQASQYLFCICVSSVCCLFEFGIWSWKDFFMIIIDR